MKNTLIIASVMVLAAVALADEEWASRFGNADLPQQIGFHPCTDDSAKAEGGCLVTVAYQLGNDKERVQWNENWRIPQDALPALWKTACVVEDGPRPSGFKQKLKRCGADKQAKK